MDKVIERILKEVSDETGVDIEEVRAIHLMPYKFMRSKIAELDINGKTSETIGDVKSNFNMPKLFKLYLDKYILDKVNKKKND